jgi:hypothetical protein
MWTLREVLAKSVGTTANFLWFSGDLEVYHFRESASLVFGGIPIVASVGSFEHC